MTGELGRRESGSVQHWVNAMAFRQLGGARLRRGVSAARASWSSLATATAFTPDVLGDMTPGRAFRGCSNHAGRHGRLSPSRSFGKAQPPRVVRRPRQRRKLIGKIFSVVSVPALPGPLGCAASQRSLRAQATDVKTSE